jgi:hypothetical protein
MPLTGARAGGTARQCLLAMWDCEAVQAGRSPRQVLKSAGRSGAACRQDAGMAARCAAGLAKFGSASPAIGNQHAQCIRTGTSMAGQLESGGPS